MATASSSTDVCIDTCVFVNFAIVGRVDVIAKISGFLFHVPQEVVDEVTVASQRQLLDEMLRLIVLPGNRAFRGRIRTER